jgi:hypothetical protein
MELVYIEIEIPDTGKFQVPIGLTPFSSAKSPCG